MKLGSRDHLEPVKGVLVSIFFTTVLQKVSGYAAFKDKEERF